jgi:hypothetical protein
MPSHSSAKKLLTTERVLARFAEVQIEGFLKEADCGLDGASRSLSMRR